MARSTKGKRFESLVSTLMVAVFPAMGLALAGGVATLSLGEAINPEAAASAAAAAETAQKTPPETQATLITSLALGEVTEMWSTPIAPGVQQIALVVQSNRGLQQIHLLEVDPSDPEITLEVGFSNGKLVGLTPVTEQARAVSRPGHRVIAAINGDSYSTSPPLGIPTDLVIHDGQLIASPGGGAVLGIMENDEAIVGMPQVTVTMSVYTGVTGGDAGSDTVAANGPDGAGPDGAGTDGAGTDGADPDGAGAAAADADAPAAKPTIRINKVNRPRGNNDIVLYTPMYAATTLTNDDGLEVVLASIQGELRLDASIMAEVREIRQQQGSTPLDEGIMVLSGAGTGEEALRQLKIGDKVAISVDISGPWERVREAIGGHPSSNASILVQDGKLGPNLDQAVHPRTAVGIRADGTLLLLTVDGRQPGYSEGVTTTELARLMLDLGAVDAVNLDGGGSTTFIARQPGEMEATVQNRPSDGYERAVGNSLLVISTAPQGPLSRLAVRPGHVRLLAGSRYAFTVKGLDEAYNPVTGEGVEGRVEWETSAGLGEISAEGILVASRSAASGRVSATVGHVRGSAAVEVVEKLSAIPPFSDRISMNPGETTVIRVTGYDAGGKPVEADPAVYRWEVVGDIGTIDETGRFTATDTAEGVSGTIRVSYSGVSTTILTDIGKPPILLED